MPGNSLAATGVQGHIGALLVVWHFGRVCRKGTFFFCSQSRCLLRLNHLRNENIGQGRHHHHYPWKAFIKHLLCVCLADCGGAWPPPPPQNLDLLDPDHAPNAWWVFGEPSLHP